MPEFSSSTEKALRPVRRSIVFEQERLREYLDTVEIKRFVTAADTEAASESAVTRFPETNNRFWIPSANRSLRAVWLVLTVVSILGTFAVIEHDLRHWSYRPVFRVLLPGLLSGVGTPLFLRWHSGKK